MDGLIDIQFTQSFIDYAKRSSSTLPESDLFSIKYQSKPQSLIDNPHQIGTIWSTPSTGSTPSIHASFPSTSSKPHVFTSIPSSPSSTSSPNPDLLLLLSNSSNCPTWNISLLPPSNQFTLKQVRSSQVQQTPKVPSQEELGKKQREFFNEGLGGFNPFKMPNSTREKGDGDTEMKKGVDERAREVKRNGKVTEAEVEDFGSFSFSPNPTNDTKSATSAKEDSTNMQEVVHSSSEQLSNSIMLPTKPKSKPLPSPSPSLPSTCSIPLTLPSLPPTAPPTQTRPQFSSKIPASSSAKPSPILPSYNKQDSISSESDSVSSSDEEFEDVSIPTPSIPKPPMNPSNPIPSFLPPTQKPAPPSSSRPLPPTSSSLRSIIHPPSSPALLPPNPPPSSSRPSVPTPQTQKTRKPSLSADQASSDSSSSSSSSGEESESDSMDDIKLEASINASLSGQGGTGKRGGLKAKAAMSSGGKGQRITSTTMAGVGNGVGAQGQGRPTISRKGLAPPPPSANQAQAQAQVGGGGGERGGVTKLNSRQGTTLSAYDQQRLAQYGHVRATSAGGVGGAVVAMDLGEESEEEEEEESGSESD